MTTIVAVVQNDEIQMGADSRVTHTSWMGYQSITPKLFKLRTTYHRAPYDGLLIGFSGTVRAGNIIQAMDAVDRNDNETPHHFVSITLVNAIRQAFAENGHLAIENQQQTTGDSSMIVGYCGNLYRMGYDFGVSQVADPFTAMGSGDQFALGSLHTTNDLWSAKRRLTIALTAAAYFDRCTAPPFHFLSLKKGETP